MKLTDQKLGMNNSISRRDILHGFGVLTAGVAAVGSISSSSLIAAELFKTNIKGANLGNNVYPPGATGLRGNHPGSFEVAHQLAREGRRDWGPVKQPDSDIYDLVVVGAGISGLASAHFYRQKHPQARILILDNHDDFGGHAKRNEFQIGDRTLIGYGGAQTLQEPSAYSEIVKGLLTDLGVDIKRFDKAYDQGFYKRHGLRGGIHFNRQAWGVDQIVPYDMDLFEGYIPVAGSNLSIEQAVAKMPLSKATKTEFIRLLNTDEDQIPEISSDNKWRYLGSISYRDFLEKHLNIQQSEIFKLLQDLAGDSGVGIETITAIGAIAYAGLPGWDAAGLGEREPTEPYIHHFPDGNASVARLLVREMIPEVASGSSMDDIVTAKFDYSKLDLAKSKIRLRLNSTVTQVQHQGDTKTAKQVNISYVQAGQAYRVQARSCVLACNNSVIPFLCPEMPKKQREALALQVKTPILYTSVALRNWQAWKKLGIGAVVSPGSYHTHSKLDFPVSVGNYQYSAGPDQPVIVHMERFPHSNNQGLSPHEQNRLGRHELITTSFETIERNVRTQLTSMLAAGGFDPAKDIIGITVNRWAHGYASWYNPLFDTVYDDWQDPRYPHMQARKPFGRIVIANADADANAMLEAAVEQGHRAVNELTYD